MHVNGFKFITFLKDSLQVACNNGEYLMRVRYIFTNHQKDVEIQDNLAKEILGRILVKINFSW